MQCLLDAPNLPFRWAHTLMQRNINHQLGVDALANCRIEFLDLLFRASLGYSLEFLYSELCSARV
jgi:hypothetical protein